MACKCDRRLFLRINFDTVVMWYVDNWIAVVISLIMKLTDADSIPLKDKYECLYVGDFCLPIKKHVDVYNVPLMYTHLLSE